MKDVLIIYPHWHPSNLAGVHRPRLLSNFLPEFNWRPVVLTVEADYYEETPDPDIYRTFRPDITVHRVKAFKAIRPWFPIGDIGLRAFYQLYKAALHILRTQKIDFIFIPIPSFYAALLGRILFEKTNTPYCIDYIDPWVRALAHYQKKWSKAWWSLKIAEILEPIAVKKAALITGVSTPYYQAVLDRNFTDRKILHAGMPYGFDPADHRIQLDGIRYPWDTIPGCKPIVYAGAFLPKSHLFITLLFQHIGSKVFAGEWDPQVHLFFLGTGNGGGERISDYAKQYGITDYVHEIPERFPFLYILNFLSAAYGVLIIGSTEAHYTASKTFQALLSKQAVFAVIHALSSAVSVLSECNADAYLVRYQPEESSDVLFKQIVSRFDAFVAQDSEWNPKLDSLQAYSAYSSAKVLAEKMNEVLSAAQEVKEGM